jgi:hypothetical protein
MMPISPPIILAAEDAAGDPYGVAAPMELADGARSLDVDHRPGTPRASARVAPWRMTAGGVKIGVRTQE